MTIRVLKKKALTFKKLLLYLHRTWTNVDTFIPRAVFELAIQVCDEFRQWDHRDRPGIL